MFTLTNLFTAANLQRLVAGVILDIIIIITIIRIIMNRVDAWRERYKDSMTFVNIDALFRYLETHEPPRQVVYQTTNKEFDAGTYLLEPLFDKYKIGHVAVDCQNDFDRYCLTITERKDKPNGDTNH